MVHTLDVRLQSKVAGRKANQVDLRRGNGRVALYKRADESIMKKQKSYNDGQRTDDGIVEPVWSCAPVLPNSLVDILDTGDDEEKDEEEFDFDDFCEW